MYALKLREIWTDLNICFDLCVVRSLDMNKRFQTIELIPSNNKQVRKEKLLGNNKNKFNTPDSVQFLLLCAISKWFDVPFRNTFFYRFATLL